jgi:uncharacterized DUF497 family protein
MTGPGAQRGVRISELLATDAAAEKLGARGISVEEAHQLPHNNHVTLRNTGRRRRSRRKLDTRRIVVGYTNGGRTLTLIVERTNDPTSWLIVTGWTATSDERRRMVED